MDDKVKKRDKDDNWRYEVTKEGYKKKKRKEKITSKYEWGGKGGKWITVFDDKVMKKREKVMITEDKK